jgi:alpha-ribazole phosphatase
MNKEDNGSLVAYFVRHGTTDGNAAGLFRGPIDYPLDAQGVKDAHKLKDFFKDKALGTAYSSDTRRALTTAETVLDSKGITPSETSDLRSWNVGYLAGLPKKENHKDINFFQENENTEVPNGESLAKFRQRVQPRIKNSIMVGIKSPHPSITFTHSSVIHELSHMLYGDHQQVKVKPGGVVGVYKQGNKLSAKALFRESKPESNYGS